MSLPDSPIFSFEIDNLGLIHLFGYVFGCNLCDEKILIDGGSTNPVPDDVVKKMGADIVISVNLDIIPLSAFVDKIMVPFIDQRKNTLPTILHNLLSSYKISKERPGVKRANSVDLPDINQGYIKI